MYEYVVKLLSMGIASILYFIPMQINYSNTEFCVTTKLSQPLTKDINLLVKRGLLFKIEYSYTIIVNDKKIYTLKSTNSIVWKNNYYVNDLLIYEKDIQERMASSSVRFGSFKFDEGDKIYVYVNAHILPDDGFTQSTGLPTSILWSYYVPRIQSNYYFVNGSFVEK